VKIKLSFQQVSHGLRPNFHAEHFHIPYDVNNRIQFVSPTMEGAINKARKKFEWLEIDVCIAAYTAPYVIKAFFWNKTRLLF